jgi:hypothetical protein
MKYLIRPMILVGIFIFSSCNLGIDTSNPQSSLNIFYSKKNNLFVSEYKMGKIDTSIFEIKEAWVEKCWMNKMNFVKTEKEETGGNQLNIVLDHFVNANFQDDNYLKKWVMRDKLHGYFSKNWFGKNGNVYSLFYCLPKLPDTFNIIVEQKNEDGTRKPIGHFTILKKKG